MKYIKQEGLRDCGVCCLFNIIRYYGGYINIEKLRQMTQTNENGTSIYNLVKAANELGFNSKAYRCGINDFHSLTFPIIAFIKLNEFNHFVIVKSIGIDKINVFDPIRGDKVYEIDDFLKEWQNIIITFDKNSELVKERDYYVNYLLCLIKDNKNLMIFLLSLSFICVCFGFIITIFLKNLFDKNILLSSFFVFLFFLIIKTFFEYIKSKVSLYLNNKIDLSLSYKIYDKIYSLPISYHHNRPAGDIASRINDIYSVEEFINTFTVSSIIDAFFIIIVLFVCIFIRFRIFFILLLITFLYLFTYYLFRGKHDIYLNSVKEKGANLNSSFIENILGIDTINNLNIQERIISKQKNIKLSYLNSYNKFISFISLQSLVLNLIESSGTIIIMLSGYKLLNNKIITIGELSMIYSMFILYFSSIKNLIILDKSFIESNISFKRIHTLLNIDNKKEEGVIIKKINSIVFENISYSYNETKVLNNINLEINKGDFLLVEGRSGRGKSTIFKLLNKELELKEGNILINNKDIKNIKSNSIKNNICYVSQNEYLFNDSIKNNIVMYKNVKKKELDKVLRITMLDKVLKDRNISLDYILEENGHNLCGGERQKVLLARTLLRNTDFIILDETMNEIDIESERRIIENIKTEYDKTLILISHRKSNNDLFNKTVLV
ncbi:MAG: ATP-binding cassette domain-containing protein [Bacilli bacterium]|nr:ATP-binding cassette domain-containing protein [Bacilli bacterium]